MEIWLSGSRPVSWAATAQPDLVWVCRTQWASGRAAWMALRMTKPAGLTGWGGLLDGVAGQVDLDQVGRGDLLEEEAVGVDQEVVFGAREAGRDVGEDQVGHPEVRHEPVDGGEFAAQPEFFRGHGGLSR